MSKQIEAMKLALEALKQIDEAMPFPVAKLAQQVIREALAEQPAQQEPVACKTLCELCVKRGYHFCANAAQTTPIPSPPAQRTWVGLTEEDRLDIWKKSSSIDGVINATASKLREKNNG